MIPHRIVIFTWFALLGKVNTQAKLASLGIILVEESICFLCGNSVESNDHLFIHCLLSYHLWSWWLQLWNAKWVFPLSVRVAIDQWASPIKGQFINEVCSVIFFTIVWTIRRMRNSRIFEKKHFSSELQDMVLTKLIKLVDFRLRRSIPILH